MGINLSVIPPDETDPFMAEKEHNDIFGTGNIGPDRIRMSMQKSNSAQAGMLQQMDQFE